MVVTRKRIGMSGSQASRCMRRTAEKVPHALDGAFYIFERVGVREPHVALAVYAEVRAADHRYACVLQQGGGEGFRLPSGAGDVRKRIEGALRRRSANAR